MNKIALSLLALLIATGSSNAAWSPPAANVYDWDSFSGIPGRIPERTVIYATHNPGDSAASINTSIANCPSNQVVKLNAGTYNIGRIDFNSKKGVTLRGSTNSTGGQTAYINSSGTPCIGSNPSGFAFAGSVSLTGGYTQGSTSIVFSATPDSQVTQDNLILIGADDNTNVLATASAAQRRYSIHRVLSKSGTTVTFTPPLPQTFLSGENPFAKYLNGGPGAILCGIEDLIINQNTANYGLEVWGADRFYVKNVFVTNIVDSGFFFDSCTQIEVRHSDVRFASGTPSNSDGYGVQCRDGTSFSRVEDNIFQNLFVSGLWMINGCAGNVCLFNFATNATAQGADVLIQAYRSNHGACPMVNLYEGNVGESFQTDGYHGNDIYLTLFRNWFHGVSTTGTGNRIMLSISRGSYFYVVAGNVLGGSWTGPGTFQYSMTGEPGYTEQSVIYRFGYPNTFNNGLTADPTWPLYSGSYPDQKVTNTIVLHGNWDYYTSSIINKAGEDTTLPASLAYSSKPAYFGSLAWPPFNPSSPGSASPDDIPAGYRFINGQDPPADAGGGGSGIQFRTGPGKPRKAASRIKRNSDVQQAARQELEWSYSGSQSEACCSW